MASATPKKKPKLQSSLTAFFNTKTSVTGASDVTVSAEPDTSLPSSSQAVQSDEYHPQNPHISEEEAKKQKRAASFVSSWQSNRSWLVYIEGEGMYCTVCQKTGKRPYDRDTWNKSPATRLRLETIKSHESCAAHKDAVSQLVLVAQYDTIPASVLPEVNLSSMSKAFACLYFLCKNRIAHTANFEPLLDFVSFLGMHIKSKICVGKNATYCSEQSIQEMLFTMSNLIEQNILEEIKQSPFYAVMFDETTDCSIAEQLVIHTRYIGEKGTVQVKYLKVLDVLKHESDQDDAGSEHIIRLNATNIANKVKDYICSKNLCFSKLVAIGTDGAAVMTGKRNGAVKKLVDFQLDAQPESSSGKCEAVGIHCAAHKLSLAASQAGDRVAYIKKFKDMLRKLYDFFDNSSVRTAGLQAVQELLDNPKLKLLQPSSTRWLSVGNAVCRLKSIFASVVRSLEREAEERHDVTAAGLHHCITDYKFVATMLMLCDVLPAVNRLSLLFQAESIDFTSVQKYVISTISKLTSLKTRDGQSLNSISTYIEELHKSGVEVRTHRSRGQTLSHHEEFRKTIQTVFLDKLIENISNRFTDTDIMFSFLSVFEPNNLPLPDQDTEHTPPGEPVTEELPLCENEIDQPVVDATATESTLPNANTVVKDAASEQSLQDYGDDTIRKMCTRFAVDEGQAVEEWGDFKHYFSEHMRHLKLRDVVHQLCSNKTHQQLYPSMSKLAQICCVVPPHTADCERDFSQVKVIKTSLRNRMKDRTLDAILRIVLEGPTVAEFPFPEAVKMWAREKNRRLKTT